jgi:hypothetical protein
MDVRNALSLAAVSGSLLDKALGEVLPGLFLNTDATSVWLEDLPPDVLLAAGSAKRLNAVGKSPQSTGDEGQRRAAQLLTTMSGAGRLVCTIVIIKDRTFKVFQHIVVNTRCGHT